MGAPGDGELVGHGVTTGMMLGTAVGISVGDGDGDGLGVGLGDGVGQPLLIPVATAASLALQSGNAPLTGVNSLLGRPSELTKGTATIRPSVVPKTWSMGSSPGCAESVRPAHVATTWSGV